MKHSPRKRFGQNFLQSQSIISSILQAINPKAQDNVLEIGPGLGAITQPLLRSLDKLTAIEIDRDLHQYLTSQPFAENKLQVISADALEIDYSQFGTNLRLVGNLPYNISTPLLLHLMHYTAYIEDMYFMLQQEVVQRMAAQPGTKAFGRLSVMLQYYCEVDYLFTVPKEAFDPQPKVTSAIVRLIPHQNSPYEPVDAKALERLVASAFAMKRKTLKNNLKELISEEQLVKLDVDPKKRPEQITVAEFVRLANYMQQQ